ncbi:SMAD/FHA domain-containing protein [Chaetomidium leptoderma]|uniref:SMAD/FHA domain-containing protein n=1 Tax=Chaetomidium leptoderma TaxID=669021 RepID=A0AAN6VEA0_9PEZI|nr:SMAD/FHA domain-containing protein [Chaetomidium leptoderma]
MDNPSPNRDNQRSSRGKDEKDFKDGRDERNRRFRDDEPRRRSNRSRSGDRGHRRRSRTPNSTSRRSRSRDRERRRDRGRDRDRDRASRRHDSAERAGERRHRDYDDERKEHRSRRSPDGRSPKRLKGRRAGEEEGAKSGNAQSLVKRSGPLPSQGDSFAVSNGEEPEKPIEKPNFGNSGALAAASNSVTQADGTTVTLKYHEPPEARKPPPRDSWKLFVFKGQDIVDTIELGSRSCWLIGRELAVVDLPAEHPSISKQHAAIQFRYTEKRNEFGDKIGRVKPYLIDLESANGTMLNSEKAPESRYLELRNKDMVQFGSSTREYVLMLAPKE